MCPLSLLSGLFKFVLALFPVFGTLPFSVSVFTPLPSSFNLLICSRLYYKSHRNSLPQ